MNDGNRTDFPTNCRYVDVEGGYGHTYVLDDKAEDLCHTMKRIFVKTKEEASVGQELTVDYGNEYFDHHPIEEEQKEVCGCGCGCWCG